MQSNVSSLSSSSTSNIPVGTDTKAPRPAPVELDISQLEHVSGGKAASTAVAISVPRLVTTLSAPNGGW